MFAFFRPIISSLHALTFVHTYTYIIAYFVATLISQFLLYCSITTGWLKYTVTLLCYPSTF